MSDTTSVWNITVRSGADWVAPIGFVDRGGWITCDANRNATLTLTSGSVTATCTGGFNRAGEAVGFVTADTGYKIATWDGSGIPDGTTFTYMNATTITLSAPATASGLFIASVRSLNCSNYASHSAKVKKAPGATASLDIAIDATRKAVGWFVPTVAGTDTENLAGKFEWDWRYKTSLDKPGYWYKGTFTIVKNDTEAADVV